MTEPQLVLIRAATDALREELAAIEREATVPAYWRHLAARCLAALRSRGSSDTLCGDPCPEASDLDSCLLPAGHDGDWHRNRSSSWPTSAERGSTDEVSADFVHALDLHKDRIRRLQEALCECPHRAFFQANLHDDTCPVYVAAFAERIVCPRCEGQTYDVGACGLCRNIGWLDESGEAL